MHPKDAAGILNSVDPDQTAPLGAVWSGSTLFAQAYLSEKLRIIMVLYVKTSLFEFKDNYSNFFGCQNLTDFYGTRVYGTKVCFYYLQ